MSSVPGTPSPNRSESPSADPELAASFRAVQIQARLLEEESGEREIARRARIRIGVTRQRVHQWVTAARYDYPPDDTADPEGDTAARQT